MRLGIAQLFLKKNINNEGQIQNKKEIQFISFFFRESIVNYLMKSNGSMNMDISLGHFYLYDTDYKLDEQQKQIPYINPEFKCIVGTTAIGIKDKKNNSMKFTDLYNKLRDGNINESLKILYTLNNESKTTTINIEMNKLTLSPNLSTLYRIFQFLNKILGLLYSFI